jgi:transmembrane sensor
MYASSLSDEEKVELLHVLQDKEYEYLTEQIHAQLTEEEELVDIDAMKWKRMAGAITMIDKPGNIHKVTPVRKLAWLAVAAAVFIMLSASLFFYKSTNSNLVAVRNKSEVKDILPGGNKAVLTLANGKKIILDNAKLGLLSDEHDVAVVKEDDGRLKIGTSSTESGNVDKYLQLTTPAGGKYNVVLPDGTRIWLNAESSIRFPTVFARLQREVEISGEAYFEVAKIPGARPGTALPFIVHTGQHTVEVLGTHFNINAYADESDIVTTLLEGKVKVTNGTAARFLKPGQQSIVNSTSAISIADADIEGTMAWKNNQFSFKNKDLEYVMRQVERWYDVKVEYGQNLPDIHFAGYISRDVPISNVLTMLHEISDLKFSLAKKMVRVEK